MTDEFKIDRAHLILTEEVGAYFPLEDRPVDRALRRARLHRVDRALRSWRDAWWRVVPLIRAADDYADLGRCTYDEDATALVAPTDASPQEIHRAIRWANERGLVTCYRRHVITRNARRVKVFLSVYDDVAAPYIPASELAKA